MDDSERNERRQENRPGDERGERASGRRPAEGTGAVGGDADVVAARSGAEGDPGPVPMTPDPDDELADLVGGESDIVTPAPETPGPAQGGESNMPEAEPDIGPTS